MRSAGNSTSSAVFIPPSKIGWNQEIRHFSQNVKPAEVLVVMSVGAKEIDDLKRVLSTHLVTTTKKENSSANSEKFSRQFFSGIVGLFRRKQVQVIVSLQKKT